MFADVTVLNPGLDRRAGQILTVQDGQIASIAADAPAGRESGATTPFAGAYALPGLIDMHVHNVAGEWELFGLLFLMHGVTAVRDTGRFDTTPVAQRQKVLAGAYPEPRFFACGPILDGDPPFSPLHWYEEARPPRVFPNFGPSTAPISNAAKIIGQFQAIRPTCCQWREGPA